MWKNICTRVQTIPLLLSRHCSCDKPAVSGCNRCTHRISTPTADFMIFVIWNIVVFGWPCLLFPCGRVLAFGTLHLPFASLIGVWRQLPADFSYCHTRKTHRALVIPFLNSGCLAVKKVSASRAAMPSCTAAPWATSMFYTCRCRVGANQLVHSISICFGLVLQY